MLDKDAQIHHLHNKGFNTGKFMSISTDMEIRYTNLSYIKATQKFNKQHIIQLLNEVGSVNIRTFMPNKYNGNPFVYGLTDVETIYDQIQTLANQGFITILHETLDVDDGGISCVVEDGYVEFTPGDTVRFIDKPSDLIYPRVPVSFFRYLIKKVYHIATDFIKDEMLVGHRVEFSIHPKPVGALQQHLVVWETRPSEKAYKNQEVIRWPNTFSNFIGDKVFGLLVADWLGFPVPISNVVVRHPRVAGFTFGKEHELDGVWTRTCPKINTPGKFATVQKYVDADEIMNNEDPDEKYIASVIHQGGIKPIWSGSTGYINDKIIVEGVAGYGDWFMEGNEEPAELPKDVIVEVTELVQKLNRKIGKNVKIEWACKASKNIDREYRIWILQVIPCENCTLCSEEIIYGSMSDDDITYIEKQYTLTPNTLEDLYADLPTLRTKNVRVTIVGNLGLTSHICDLLRKHKIASRIERTKK